VSLPPFPSDYRVAARADDRLEPLDRAYAKAVASNPADVTVERIGDLMSYELPAALTGGRTITFSAEVTR
jgi:hypothetical protein